MNTPTNMKDVPMIDDWDWNNDGSEGEWVTTYATNSSHELLTAFAHRLESYGMGLEFADTQSDFFLWRIVKGG